jgi:polar amino acid transport system substrate-binding protein
MIIEMKRRLLSVLLVLLMIFGLTACKKESAQSGSNGEDNSLKYIQDNGKLVLGLDATFEPMGFTDDNGKIVGFDIDLATEVCKKLGVELVTQPIDWDAKNQELNTKSIDCIWNGLSVTEENLKNMTMTDSYMANEISLVVKKDSSIASMADMAGKKLAVQSGSSAEQTLDSDEKKEIKDSLAQVNPFDDYTAALMDLDTGSSDAVLMDSVMANYKIKEQGMDYKVLGDTLLEDKYAIGFRKGDQALCDAVWNAIKELKEDGTLAEISEKWFGADVTTIK